jgi:hypothetical protein
MFQKWILKIGGKYPALLQQGKTRYQPNFSHLFWQPRTVLARVFFARLIHLTLSSPLTTTTIYNLQHQHQHAAVQLHQHDHEHTPRSSAAGLPFKFQLLLVAPTDLLLFHGLHYNTINCIVHHHPHDPRHRT